MFGATGAADGTNPVTILLMRSVWYDGLTKNGFMTVMEQVKRAAVAVMWTFQKNMGAPAPRLDPMVA
jgi:hypothetical protein